MSNSVAKLAKWSKEAKVRRLPFGGGDDLDWDDASRVHSAIIQIMHRAQAR